MFWSILLGALFLFVSLRYLFEGWWREDPGQWLLSVGASVLLGAMGFFFGALGASGVDQVLPRQWTGPETVQLSSFRNEGSIYGQLFLVVEKLGFAQSYSFFVRDGDGVKTGYLLRADSQVKVVEQEGGNTATLHTYSYELTVPWLVWFGRDAVAARRYEFFIPKGSLKVDS